MKPHPLACGLLFVLASAVPGLAGGAEPGSARRRASTPVQADGAAASSNPQGIDESLPSADIPMVISVVKHAQRAGDAPASVEVITSGDIERYGFRTLAEALQSLPGMYVDYDRNYAYVGVRGFLRQGDFNARLQMLLNGHAMADTSYDYTPVGEDLGIDMTMVDRIEVVYGPGSALYGSNALFATINIITKAPDSVRGTRLDLEGGSFGRWRGHLRHGRKIAGWETLVSTRLLDVRGHNLYFPEYDALGLSGGTTRGTDFEKSYGTYGRAERGPLSIQAFGVYREKGIPTASFGTVFDDDANRTTDTHWFLDMQYRRKLGETTNFTLRGAYDDIRYWATYRYDVGGGVLVDNIDTSVNRSLSQDVQLDWTASKRHRLTFGESFTRNFDVRLENHDDTPYFSYADLRVAFNELSVYAQHEFSPGRGWHLTNEVRHDNYPAFGAAFSPRSAIVYAPGERWRVKLVGGRAFRAPNAYELFYDAVDIDPALSLDPEVVTSYELGLESRLTSRLNLRLAGYRNRIRDLITLVDIAPGVTQFTNLEQALTYGGEVMLRARFLNGTSGYLSYSYMRGEDGSGAPLTDYPPQSWKAGVSLPMAGDRWRVSADMRYYDGQLTLAGARSPDIFVTNLTLLAPFLHRNTRLSASIYNLLDRDYGLPARAEHADLALIPQDGRSLSLRLVAVF
jgi:iron complex outermembrane receptor protein